MFKNKIELIEFLKINVNWFGFETVFLFYSDKLFTREIYKQKQLNSANVLTLIAIL